MLDLDALERRFKVNPNIFPGCRIRFEQIRERTVQRRPLEDPRYPGRGVFRGPSRLVGWHELRSGTSIGCVVELVVGDRATGTLTVVNTTTVITGRELMAMADRRHEQMLYRVVFDTLHRAVQHEVQEAFEVDGKRIYDPHEPDPAPMNEAEQAAYRDEHWPWPSAPLAALPGEDPEHVRRLNTALPRGETSRG